MCKLVKTSLNLTAKPSTKAEQTKAQMVVNFTQTSIYNAMTKLRTKLFKEYYFGSVYEYTRSLYNNINTCVVRNCIKATS